MSTLVTETLDRLIDQARQRLAIGDAPGACELACRVLRHQPDHLRGRAVHARALLDMHRPTEALDTLDAAHLAQQDADHDRDPALAARLLVLRAEAMIRTDQSLDAAEALEQALRHRPNHVPALWRLANLCLHQGAADRTIRLLKRLLCHRPNRRAAWRLLAQAYETIGCADLAIGIYEQFDRRDAATSNAARRAARLRLAHLHREADHWPEAADELEALMDADPHDPALACEAAQVAAELGEDAHVVRDCRAALRSRPDHAPARVLLAEQHLRCGRFAQAAYQWWRLSRFGADRGQALAGLLVAAICADRLALADRVTVQFDQCCDPPARQRHLSHLWQLAMPGLLLADLRHGPAHADRSRFLPALLTDAADALEEHLESHENHADRHYHLAICRAGVGQVDLAATSLDRALRLNAGYLAAARKRVELLIDESNLAAAAMVVRSAGEARPEADPALVDLQVGIEVMRGGVDRAAAQLAEVDQAHRPAIAASVRRLLEHYATPNVIAQWDRAHTAATGGESLALDQAA